MPGQMTYRTAHQPIGSGPLTSVLESYDAPQVMPDPIIVEWEPRVVTIEYPRNLHTGWAPPPHTFIQAYPTEDASGKVDVHDLARAQEMISDKFRKQIEEELMAGTWSTEACTATTADTTFTHEFTFETARQQMYYGSYAGCDPAGTDSCTTNYTTSTTSGDTFRVVNGYRSQPETFTFDEVQATQVWGSWNVEINETQEQREEREKRAAQRLERQEQIRIEAAARERERAAERALANARAEELLKAVLDEEQRVDYDLNGSFVVCVKKTKYKITKGRTGNVKELDKDGNEKYSYCIHPNIACPDGDTLAAQKLMLETNEREFKKIANRSLV